jgi:hypothetical protein
MSDQIDSEYTIPLSEEELADLGRFSALWGQMDLMICMVLSLLTNCSLPATLTFVGGSTTGPKLNLLQRQKVESKETAAHLKQTCARIGRLLEDRNHIAHGMWGMHTDDKGVGRAGSFFPRRGVDDPLCADRLSELCEDVAIITRDLGKLMSLLNPKYRQQKRSIVFYFSSHAPAGTTADEWSHLTPRPPDSSAP